MEIVKRCSRTTWARRRLIVATLVVAGCADERGTEDELSARLAALEAESAERDALVSALEGRSAQMEADLGALRSRVDALEGMSPQDISSLEQAIASLEADHMALATAHTATSQILSGHTTDLATHSAAIATLDDASQATADLLSAVDTELDTAQSTVSSLAMTSANQATSLASLEDEVADVLRDLATLPVRATPALFEWIGSNVANGDRRLGRSGLSLVTSGGAFRFSGYPPTANDVLLGTREYWVTFYVRNPGSSSVVVSARFCTADETTVVVDGAQALTFPDLDGACAAAPSMFTLTPGAHVVQLRTIDANNDLEGVGIRNAWITENGLEVDYEAYAAAQALGLL